MMVVAKKKQTPQDKTEISTSYKYNYKNKYKYKYKKIQMKMKVYQWNDGGCAEEEADT